MSVIRFNPRPSRLDVLPGEIRASWTSATRDFEITRALLKEAQAECWRQGQSWDKWCRSHREEIGIAKRQIENILAGFTSSHRVVHPVHRLPREIGCWPHGAWGHGASNNWITPQWLFDGLAVRFELDPAYPSAGKCNVPADKVYTRAEDGLVCSWEDLFCWLNPPFGRGVIDLWCAKFAAHGNGICLCPERTSTHWYRQLAAKADLILMLNRKLHFIQPDEPNGRPFPIGTHLVAYGERGVIGLENAYRNGLGLLVQPYIPAA
jgi:hypothetical protein